MVQIPIAGQMFEIMFDSCGDWPGLDLNKIHWQAIESNLNVKRLRKSHIDSYQSGRVSVQKVVVSQISIGEKILKNVDVVINDNPDGLSVMSLGYFQDTIVVLDFVNNLMWIKK